VLVVAVLPWIDQFRSWRQATKDFIGIRETT
jgi:hypothetical protein